MRLRRTTVALLTLTLAATACGAGSSGGGSAAAPADASATAESTAADDGIRTVSHDQGETEVPAEPERVVVLDSPHLDTALSLGVTPVAAVSVFADEGLPGYLGERTEGIDVVGTIEEPDLEAIAALEPDLILSATVRHEGIYGQLSQIAPTVFTASSGTDWKQGFELVAEALGKQDEGQQALDDHAARVAALGEELGAKAATAAIVRFLPGETRIYGPDTFSGSVLTEVGFDLPDLEYDEYSMAYISAEQVEVLADADAIFTTTYGDPAETTQGEVTSLWSNLAAVDAGCQFAAEDSEWMIGIGLIGADIILDDLEASLGDAGCI
jgi:iron complex transport system substrate-binding protein